MFIYASTKSQPENIPVTVGSLSITSCSNGGAEGLSMSISVMGAGFALTIECIGCYDGKDLARYWLPG